MKVTHKSLFTFVLAVCLAAFGSPLLAQNDDVYYDPNTDAPPPADYRTDEPANNSASRNYDDGDDQYDGDSYDYEDDYAYEYSSRVRRFHRNVVVYDYYDPFYTDLYFYDPYYLPGASIYTGGYNDYWSYRQWRRWNRYNSWNAWAGFNNPYYGWGWNSWGGGYNPYSSPWHNPYVCNNYYYDPYWTWNGYNPYYSNTYVNNNYYYNNQGGNQSGYKPQTYTGPRRNGTSVNPGYVQIKDKSGRLNPAGPAPAIELNGRQPVRNQVESDREPVSKTDRINGRQPATPSKPTEATKAPQTQTGRTRPDAAGRPQEARPTDVSPAPGRQPQTRPRTDDARPAREPQQQTRPRTEDTRPAQRQPQQEARPQREQPQPSRRSYDQPREQQARPQRETPTRSDNDRREMQRPTRSNDTPTRSNTETKSSRTDSGSSSGRSNSGSSNTSTKSSRTGRN